MGAWALQKAESEELEVQKPQVKLRRTVSEVARPASTPPIMASAIKDEDDEDRIIAELEVGGAHLAPRVVSQALLLLISGQGGRTKTGSWTQAPQCAGLVRTPSFLPRFPLHCKMGEGV